MTCVVVEVKNDNRKQYSKPTKRARSAMIGGCGLLLVALT
jgi:hypothetical protein